jgi:hypothetical protein
MFKQMAFRQTMAAQANFTTIKIALNLSKSKIDFKIDTVEFEQLNDSLNHLIDENIKVLKLKRIY